MKNAAIGIRAYGTLTAGGVGRDAFEHALFDLNHLQADSDGVLRIKGPDQGVSSSPREIMGMAIDECCQQVPELDKRRDVSGVFLATATPPEEGGSISDWASFFAKSGFNSPHLCFTNACSASVGALRYGINSLLNSDKKYCVVCALRIIRGTDIAGFAGLGLLRRREVCRPFDKQRRTITLGEACVCFLLQRVDYTSDPGDEALCWITGCTYDYSPTGMLVPDAECLSRQITVAARRQQVGTVVTHGTGTIANDKAELTAIDKAVDHTVSITSVKSLLGHTLEASALVSVAATIAAIRRGQIPATRNCVDSISTKRVSVVRQGEYVRLGSGVVAINAIGIDGGHGCICIHPNFCPLEDVPAPGGRSVVVASSLRTGNAPLEEVEVKPGEPSGLGLRLVTSLLGELKAKIGMAVEAAFEATWEEADICVISPACNTGGVSTDESKGSLLRPDKFLGQVPSYAVAIAMRELGCAGALLTLGGDLVTFFRVCQMMCTGQSDSHFTVIIYLECESQDEDHCFGMGVLMQRDFDVCQRNR